MPKITVVMPTYNQDKFIAAAIESVIDQTLHDWQLIIVDDGSTDQTRRIAQHYSDTDKRIRYFYKDNGGTGSALNYGFKYSDTPYETWFSSDNILYPSALASLADHLDTYPDCDYVYANCEIGVMDHTGLIEEKRKNLKDEISQVWDPGVFQYHYFLGIVWLWRREIRIRTGEFQLEPCEDYDFVLRALEAGCRFEFLDKCLGWFRRHGENMSMKIRKSNICYSSLVQQKAAQRRAARLA